METTANQMQKFTVTSKLKLEYKSSQKSLNEVIFCCSADFFEDVNQSLLFAK